MTTVSCPPSQRHHFRPGVRAEAVLRRNVAVLVGIALSLISAGPSLAENLDRVELPPWRIETHVDRRLVTARDDSFAATLGPTAMVSAEGWAKSSIATLAEALRRTPGVVLQESFGGFEPPRLSLRGSGLDSAPTSRGVALLVDGLPLARGDGSFNSALFDPLLFSRVEIYRGTMHEGVTPAALGGVINAATFEPAPSPTVFRLEAGTFGARRVRFGGETGVADRRFRIAAAHDQQDGWRQHSAQQRTTLNASLRQRIGARTWLDTSVYAAQLDYEVPGPLTLAQALSAPRTMTAAVARDRPARWSSVLRTVAQVKSENEGSSVAAGLSGQRLSDQFRQLVANGETDSVSTDVNAHATLTRWLEGRHRHQLLLRTTYSGGTNHHERFVNLQGSRGPLFGEVDLRSTTAALNLEDLVWLRPDLAVGAGCTVLSARREVIDRHGTRADVARTRATRDFSPRAGLLWQVRSGLALQAAVSRGVEPPATEELLSVQGNVPDQQLLSRDLLTQRATTIEFGLRGDNPRLSWNLTAYWSEWRNEILRLADANGQARGAVNAARTHHEGLEAALRWRLVDRAGTRWLASVNANLNSFRFVADPVYHANRLAGAPPFSGWAELLYINSLGWQMAAESTYTVGRTAADHARQLTYGGATLFHLRASWPLNPHVTVFAAVRNVGDRRSIASTAGVLDLARNPAATAIFLPGNGRGFTLGLEYH